MDQQTKDEIISEMRNQLRSLTGEIRKRDIHIEAIKQGAVSPHHIADLAPSDGTPAEAIQQMRDSGEHDNLFVDVTSVDVATMSPKRYRELRQTEAGREAIGLA